MSAVYDATHRNGMRGAVKILDAHLATSIAGPARKRFLREGRLANRVQHPGAVRVLDDDQTEDGSAYLVMELLKGSTLDALAACNDGKLSPPKVIEYGLQIVDTLAEAHASGIIHRDIKPENLFLTTDGIVKVLDFGIAGMVVSDGSATLTRTGDPVGTPAFMAPEQARGRWELVDHQSDLYSLGSSLFTLLTGQLVNEASTVAEMLVLAMKRNAPSLIKSMPDALPALVRAIDGALALEKSKRWSSAEAMRDALEAAYLELTHRRPPARIASIPSEDDVSLGMGVRLIESTMSLRRFPRPRWLVTLALVGITAAAFAAVVLPRKITATAATPIPTTALAGSTAPIASVAPPTRMYETSTAPSAAITHRYDPIYDRRQ